MSMQATAQHNQHACGCVPVKTCICRCQLRHVHPASTAHTWQAGMLGGPAARLTHKLPRSTGGQHDLAVAQMHGLRRIADHVRHRLG